MATASDIATAAIRKLGVRNSESTIEDFEMADALDALNDIGSNHLWFSPVTDSSTDLRIPRQAVGPLKSILAQKLMPEYTNVQLTKQLQDDFDSGWEDMRRITNGSLNVKFPNTVPIGSGNQDCNNYLLENEFFNDSSTNF